MTEAQARKATGDRLLRMARRSTVVVLRNGKPSWVVARISEEQRESLEIASSPAFRRLVRKSHKGYVKSGGIRLEDVKKQYDLK
jgi:hypothetical protein